jgi:ceramidase
MPIACPSLIGRFYPELCTAVDHYCERTSSALDAEPINALTNAAFLIGACVAWRIRSTHPRGDKSGLVVALILTMALVGLGSFLFHTVATRWAEWADVLPIMLFMLLYLWLVLTTFFGWPAWLKALALAAYFAATFYAEASVSADVLWGGALYVPTVLLMLVIGASLYLRQMPGAGAFLTGTAVFVVSFAARTLDRRVCPVFPVGTHFLWHLLNATLLFILIRAAIVYSAPAEAARRNRSSVPRPVFPAR